MVSTVLRNTVGVRNPFALAEAKLGKEINWSTTSAGKKKELLERAFGTTYAEIFNPQNTNPAFIHPVKSGSGDATQCDAAKIRSLIIGWGKNPHGSTIFDPAGSVGSFSDPVQGALSDCYLMAAMSSIAFASSTKPLFFKNLVGSSVNIKLWDNFVTTNGVTAPKTSTTMTVKTDHFPLQKSGNLVFARSNTPAEIWPAIYEKAFAEWKCGGSLDEPDYSKLCQGNPITALSNITGYKFSTASVFETKSFSTSLAIYDKIATACNAASPAYPNDRTTRLPVVAYTYDSALPGYSNATMVRNHSYSVLGVQKSGTSRYIILRNPWGQVPPPAIVDPSTLDKNRCILDALGDPVICFGDPNLGADVLSANSWTNITNLADPNDGIFGLHADAFKNYFQGFGWVFA